MSWFRAHIRLGSRLALAALAIQFALAFAHSHRIEPGPAAPQFASISGSNIADRALAAPAATEGDQARLAPAPHDEPADTLCAICAVVALASALLIAPAPALPPHPPAADAGPSGWRDAVAVVSIRSAFQPRAPPLS